MYYKLDSQIETRPLEDGDPLPGNTGDLHGWAAMKCVDIENAGSEKMKYLFAFNAFDVNVGVGETKTSIDAPGSSNLDSNAAPLGQDMYFQLSAQGEVEKIWAYTKDDGRLIRMRVGMINALSTSVVSPDNPKKILESDSVGVHYSHLSAKKDGMLFIKKQFETPDFKSFIDDAVEHSMVQFLGEGTVALNNGLHHSATLIHDLTVLKAAGTNSDDVNIHFHTRGAMTLSPLQEPAQEPVTIDDMTFENVFELADKGELIESTIYDLTMDFLHMSTPRASEIEPNEVYELLSQTAQNLKNEGDQLKKVHKLVEEIEKSTDSVDLIRSVFNAIQRASQNSEYQVTQLGLFVLAGANTQLSSDALSTFVRYREDPTVKVQAVRLAAHCAIPSSSLVEALIDELDDEELLGAVVLSLGSVAGKVEDPELVDSIVNMLLSLVDSSDELLRVVIGALGNIGDHRAIDKTLKVLKLGVVHLNPSIRAQSVFALRKLDFSRNNEEVIDILKQALVDEDKSVRSAAETVSSRLGFGTLSTKLSSSLFPFNVSWSEGFEVGGTLCGLDGGIELFAGTNFDCTQPSFNYEVLGRAKSDVWLFDSRHSLLLAEAVYGKANMAPLADHVLLTVWDEVIYDKKLGAYDCKDHVKDVLHTAPGVKKTWTFFISVIPLQVSVGASLNLDIKWGWGVCDGDLSAHVYLLPTAVVSVYGSSEINLLLIAAGVKVSGSLNSQLVPDAYVKGSLCKVGLQATYKQKSMSVDVDAYYKVHKCFLWFFNCKLKESKSYNVWHWGLAPSEKVVYKKDWDIVKK